jgi:hypothetical protein
LMVTALAMFRTSNRGYQAPAKPACICAQPSFDLPKVKVFGAKTGQIRRN